MDLSNMNWWIAFRDPMEIWKENPTFLLGEFVAYFLVLLTLSHALRHGGRYPYLWISTVLHGLTVESLSYFEPNIDNFWHAQSTIMLLGKRLPLHIMLFYPMLLYPANIAVSRLHLSKLAEPFAVGLAVVLLDVPFDIMGIKLLWWTWHDTDPNIFDRMYWVPWTSYYFHSTFACGFSFLFTATRRLLTRTPGFVSDGLFREILCCLIVGAFSMPAGVLQFLPLYHPLHDGLKLHTEVCVLLILTIYMLIAWTSDRHPKPDARPRGKTGWMDEIFLLVSIHFSLYILLAVFAQPEMMRSTGLHEPIGNCNATSPVLTAFGQVLSKKTFLCPTKYDEGYFDWHCLAGGRPPKDGSTWYTACGTAFGNHAEYITVVTAFALLGYYVYVQMLAFSGKLPTAKHVIEVKSKKQKTH